MITDLLVQTPKIIQTPIIICVNNFPKRTYTSNAFWWEFMRPEAKLHWPNFLIVTGKQGWVKTELDKNVYRTQSDWTWAEQMLESVNMKCC